MVMQNLCYIPVSTINSQYVNNRHANKQLVNCENWSLKCYQMFYVVFQHDLRIIQKHVVFLWTQKHLIFCTKKLK